MTHPASLAMLCLLGTAACGDPAEAPWFGSAPAACSAEAAVLFLAFDGVQVTRGIGSDAVRNVSYLCGGTFPPFDHTRYGTDRAEVLADVARRVQQLFADFNLRVVSERPATGPYDMVVVGGAPRLCGYPEGFGGLAHLDCGNALPSDIGFVFSETITDLAMLAVAVAHETGHGFGLPHTAEPCDVMSSSICAPTSKRFLDQLMAVQPDALGNCDLSFVDSWRKLYHVLGPRPGGMDGGTPQAERDLRPPSHDELPPSAEDRGAPAGTVPGCALTPPAGSPPQPPVASALPMAVLIGLCFCRRRT